MSETIDKDKIQKKLVNLTWTKTDTFMILISPLNFQSSMIKKYSQCNDLKNSVYKKRIVVDRTNGPLITLRSSIVPFRSMDRNAIEIF